MNIGDAAKKLVLFSTVQELECWIKQRGLKVHISQESCDSAYFLEFLMNHWVCEQRLEKSIYGAYGDTTAVFPNTEIQKHIFLNVLAAALLTFSYLEELEWKSIEETAGVDLSALCPAEFYAGPDSWIEYGLKSYAKRYTSLCQDRKNKFLLLKLPTTEDRRIAQDLCRSAGISPRSFVLPYTLLPETIRLKGGSKKQEVYRIAHFLSPITVDLTANLVMNQRDSANYCSTRNSPSPILDHHICAMFYRAARVLLISAENNSFHSSTPKTSIAVSQMQKSRLMKNYNYFLKVLMECPAWAKQNLEFPDQIMLHYAWELLAHPRAISELEDSIHEARYQEEEECVNACKRAIERFRIRSAIPLVFGVDQLILDNRPHLQRCHKYMRTVVADIYLWVKNDIHAAAELTRSLILTFKSSPSSLTYPTCSATDIIGRTPKKGKISSKKFILEFEKVISVLSAYTDHHYFEDVKIDIDAHLDATQFCPAAICTENSETPINLYGIKDGKKVSIEELN